MEGNQEIALNQMRKSVQKLGSSTEKYGDPTLLRFLIARSMDPEKAGKMFVQWQKWRASLVPNGFIAESEVVDELASRKIYLQGLSKNGYPVMIVKASKHFPAKDQLQFKKFVVHLLDKTIASSFKGREIGNEKLLGILDLQHITYKNIDARGLITGFQFLQIVIVTNEDENRNFIQEVGEEILPEEYGGRAKLVAIQDVVLPPLDG
ncbi:uncharacterized protein LOC107429238 isoform X2 [Ziziphus jujuba]|uniref:Uncharacterized protein LOC107429238 isoform X2 n=1 Tax=Ziziphus jujuba TaxID=326968 RepID=A0ABM3I231_ZIZJJ|nr:uncharacterized protein LOC107429238 isoform X2 [Ziziphus jujuba]